MENNQKNINTNIQNKVAYWTLAISGLSIIVLAIFTMYKGDATSAMTIFNTTLPVFASWIGTVLAFYFGKESFESANQQVQQMVKRMSPIQKSNSSISSIMRSIYSMAIYRLPKGIKAEDIGISDLLRQFNLTKVTRLPIIDDESHIKFMVHESKLNKYLAQDGSIDDTFGNFLEKYKDDNILFDEGQGFVIVSELSSIANAKQKMEENKLCQDIFITKAGTIDEPIVGWISNIRLIRYLEV